MKVNRKYVWAGGALAAVLLIFLWWGRGEADPDPVTKLPAAVEEKRKRGSDNNTPSISRRDFPPDRSLDPHRNRPCFPCDDEKLDEPKTASWRRECRELLRSSMRNGIPDPDTSHLGGCRGRTPLHYAGNEQEVLDLIAAGADPNAADEVGSTPLHRKALSGRGGVKTFKALLEAGADPNAADMIGDTPLHIVAEERGDPEIVKALLEAGADPEITNIRGRDPLTQMQSTSSPPASSYKLRRMYDDPSELNREEMSREILDALDREAEIQRLLMEAHPQLQGLLKDIQTKRDLEKKEMEQ